MSGTHKFDLPSSPNLEQNRKRAKDLLKGVRANDRGAIARFRSGHPRLGGASSELIRKEARLADARWVIAREYGFASWARFKAHVEALGGKTELRHPFETDPQYYRDRAAGMLGVFGTGEQNAIRLVRLFHPDYSAASETDVRAASLRQAYPIKLRSTLLPFSILVRCIGTGLSIRYAMNTAISSS